MNSLYSNLKERLDLMKNARSQYESQWREIAALVRPTAPPLTATVHTSKGKTVHDRIYDGTALLANEELASGLASYLTSPQDRWFSFAMTDKLATETSLSERKSLEKASEALYHYFSLSKTAFNTSVHEVYLELGAFGTAVMYVFWNPQKRCMQCRTYPLFDCYIDENENGEIDVLFRESTWTARQIIAKFGIQSVSKLVAEADASKEFVVVHGVFPRTERKIGSPTASDKPYSSVYFMHEDQTILHEGGFDSFPFLVPRWSKLAGEVYGRSPAMSCLPDVLMINHMMKEMIICAQLSNRPPIVVEEDSMILPMAYKPGAILTKSAGSEFPQPLMSGINPQITFEMMMHSRQHINSCFFIDFLKQDMKKERQTAYEIADRRDEKLRLLGPILSRLEVEFLEPLIVRVLTLLKNNTEFTDSYEFLQKGAPRISFVSSASRAQLRGRAIDIARTIEELAPMANIFPEVFTKFHPDRFIEEYVKLRNVNPTVLRSQQEMDELRQQQAQQAQQLQQAETAPAMAKSMKDMAQANQLMGGM